MSIIWGVSLPLACLAALALAADLPRRLEQKRLESILHLLMAAPFLIMASLFLADAHAYRLVWEHGGSTLPYRYRLAALWEGREGPLLMWAACMALVSWFNRRRGARESLRVWRLRLGFMHGFTAFLLFLAWTMGAFDAAANPDAARTELNELLQTDLMVIHPPLIFLYYSLCIALGAAVLGYLFSDDWVDSSLRETLLPLARPALLVGTLGIGLGGLWAYTVLDWGGYWAWDPVETASLLPWLALVVLLHLPQRPGKTDSSWWLLAGLMPAMLAIVSTLVTRANGVWVSRHAFVGDGSGSVPEDVWGRLMLIRGDVDVGVEVMGYLLLVILSFSTWVAWLLKRSLSGQRGLEWQWMLPWALVPASAVFATFIGMMDAELAASMFWGGMPGFLICILGFAPLGTLYHQREEFFSRLRGPANLLILLGSLAAAFFAGDFILGGLLVLIILPLVVCKRPQDAGGLLVAPIIFWIFASWAQLVAVQGAAVGMGCILIPWLFMSDEESGRVDLNALRFSMAAPSVVGATFLLLTWMLLYASIDAPRFESHELLGSVLITPVILAMSIYGWRRNMANDVQFKYASAILLLALLMAVGFTHAMPGDSSDVLSGSFKRGHVAWLLALPLIVAIPSMGREVVTAINRLRERLVGRGMTGSSTRWRTAGAHLVHIGLLLLLLGHVFTTTLVDRGSAQHRQTLVRDVPMFIGDHAYIFREVVILPDEDPEFDQRFLVGDGYIGVRVDVHAIEGGDVGELLATVEPGVLRFDSPNGRTTGRSEIARHAQLSGDLIVIFDSSQVSGLMTASFMGQLEEVDSIRLTIHDLRGSHLVWGGWVVMMLGMLMGASHWSARIADEEE